MDSIATAYFNANGIIGLIREQDPTVHRVENIDSTHVTNTLWQRSPNAIINPVQNSSLARYRFAMWRTLSANIAPGSGCVGRAVTVTVAWGSSAISPNSESDVANLPGAVTYRLGGLQDPSMASFNVPLIHDMGEFSVIVRPQQSYGYPRLYCWVTHAKGPSPLSGSMLHITFSGTLEVWTTPARI